MNYQNYSRSISRYNSLTVFLGNEFLKHHKVSHEAGFEMVSDGIYRNVSTNTYVTEGNALVAELTNPDYLFSESIRAYLHLYSNSKNITEEKILSFITRSLLEIYERRISFFAHAPEHVKKSKSEKYIFISAHLFINEMSYAMPLIEELMNVKPEFVELNQKINTFLETNNRKKVMKMLSFDDGQYVTTGTYLNPIGADRRRELYSLYSLAIHGDPFATTALELDTGNDWHFLLSKTLQLAMTCEVLKMMYEQLLVDDCDDCFKRSQKFNRIGNNIKNRIASADLSFAE